jgi:hypothetical protein
MKTQNNDNRLDELLTRAIGQEAPVFDLRQWMQRYPRQAAKLEAMGQSPDPAAIRSLSRWRSIMKSRITKLAAAAAIMIVVGTFALTLNHTQPAWAVEDSIQAMQNIDTVYICGKIKWENGKIESIKSWNRPCKEKDLSGDMRQEIGDQQVIVVNEKENTSYTYNIPEKTVKIESGFAEFTSLTGSLIQNGGFLKELRESNYDHPLCWQLVERKEYRQKLEETGTDCIFIKIVKHHPQNSSLRATMLFAFDPATRLPVKYQAWENGDAAGDPVVDMELEFNVELPDGFFEFQIPPGARVIDERDKEKNDGSGAFLNGRRIKSNSSQIPASDAETHRRRIHSSEEGPKAKVNINGITYVVKQSFFSKNLVLSGDTQKHPNGIYLFVELSVQNGFTSPWDIPEFVLKDQSNKIYPLSSDLPLLKSPLSPHETINVNRSKTGYLLFDVPSDGLTSIFLVLATFENDISQIELKPKQQPPF